MIKPKIFQVNGTEYTIRPAKVSDAPALAELRLQIDGETEHFDRVQGEGLIDEGEFKELILLDTSIPNHLFLVAEVEGNLVGFSRCEGSHLKRLKHQVEFGVGVIKEFWGLKIGQVLLSQSILWAHHQGLVKMTLKVIETNKSAIYVYKKYEFEIEGILKKHKRLSDGHYYNTLIMSRFFS
ncbi:GNAT family N-acetyltransferase [Priestia flexa]|uniref:GNAT family N-acetyltransferase n=1 Tax=Priestia flexa TaxID=86664 RepID=UPI000970B558|nr:GNAT family N-acetyltransferase [Priestia flexa]